jgi:hypothetical protein
MRQGKIALIALFMCGGADVAVRRSCERSRKRKLRELYNYTALLNANRQPQLLDWVISDEPAENEARFLDQNDISRYAASFCCALHSFGFIMRFHIVVLTMMSSLHSTDCMCL